MGQDSNGRADPLYVALDHFEDAMNEVGVLTIATQGCYGTLTKAIGGYGDLEEAKAAFAFEAALLINAHENLAKKAQTLNAAVADGLAWQETFTVVHPKRCAQCGCVLASGERGTCSDCVSTNVEALDQISDHSLGNPFEETDRQRYGERNVLDTALLQDCE